MTTIRTTTRIEIEDENGGVLRLPPTFHSTTGLTKFEIRKYSIADSTTQNAWDPLAVDTEAMADFDYLAILSDGDVYVEFVTDDGGEVGKVVDTKKLVKNLWLILGADDSYGNPGADDAFSGTADLIERIRFRNDSGATRKVKVVMAT